MPHLLLSADLLLFRSPREEFKLLVRREVRAGGKEKSDGNKEGNGEERDEEAYPERILRRICWVGKLIASPRFIGWYKGTTKDKIPVVVTAMSRRGWLVRKCVEAGLWFVVIDATNAYSQRDDYILGAIKIDSPFFRASLAWMRRSLCTYVN